MITAKSFACPVCGAQPGYPCRGSMRGGPVDSHIARRGLAAEARRELLPRVTLETCICGKCTYCPDGWHTEDEMPCSCTADCALTEDRSATGGST